MRRSSAAAALVVGALAVSAPGSAAPAPPLLKVSSPASCAGIQADLLTDAANCGACGHACVGRACSKGVCGDELVSVAKDVTSIAVAGASVLWTSDTGVYQAPRAAGATSSRLYTSMPGAFALVVDGSDVYWREGDGSVWAGTIAGAQAKQLAPPKTKATTNVDGGLALDGGVLYWAEEFEIWKVSNKGGNAARAFFFPKLSAHPMRSVIAESGDLDWVQDGVWHPTPGMASGKSTNGWATLRPYGGDCGVLASHGNDVVVFDPHDDPVLTILSRVGSPSVDGPAGPWAPPQKDKMKPPQCVPAAVAIDGAFAYFTLPGGVYRAPLAGGDELLLAKTSSGGGIAVDATHVYFADDWGIERVGK